MANLSAIKLPNGTTYNLVDKTSGYTTNTGTITGIKTTNGAHSAINVTSGVATFNIPTKTSHLTNDSGFLTSHLTGTGAIGVENGEIKIVAQTAMTGGTEEYIYSITNHTVQGISGFLVLCDDGSGDGMMKFFPDMEGVSTASQAIINQIPTKTSDLTNDSGFLTTETDPTVPSWAKASTKPTYTASEVGALASNTTYVSKITTTAGAHTAISNKSGAVSFNVPTTAAHVGIKFGYTTSGNNRAVLQDSSGNLYVTQKDDNTTYSSKAAASGGTDVSLVTTGEKYTWNSKTSNTGTVTSVAASGSGGITISGSPITTSGTISIGLNLSTAINGLGEGTSQANINDYAVVQYAGGGTTTTTYHRRKLSNLIVGKAVSDQNGLRIDTGYLKLTGGQVTGPTIFGDTVSIDDLNAGQLVVSGSASVANNLQVNTINGVAVGSNPKFTDTVTTVTTTGSGNAVTAITASNGVLTVTKGATYSNNAGTITSVKTTAGAHTAINVTSGAVSFNVPTTAAHVGIKFGYTTSGNNRAVLQDSSGNLYVTQKDTDTTVSTLTLDEDTGTSAITLAHSGKYKLTAGTKTLIFTMPSSGNTDHRKSFYGTCSTAAGTAAKVISLSTTTGWELVAGTTITVKFSATNTAQNPTFNVNSSGAKSVWYDTAVITTGSLNRAGYANRPQMYVYDGSHWVWMGMSAEDNTTYSVMSASELSTGTATTARTMSAANTKTGLLNLFYPVGSYYETSDTDFDPNTAWGGTWVLETAGQVHVSAGTGYAVGATGGATTSATGSHTLTASEIPAHTHGSKSLTGTINMRYGSVTGGAGGIIGSTDTTWSGSHTIVSTTTQSNPKYHHVTVTATHEHTSVGGSGSHNHGSVSTMQPYIVVNRWHRTA